MDCIEGELTPRVSNPKGVNISILDPFARIATFTQAHARIAAYSNKCTKRTRDERELAARGQKVSSRKRKERIIKKRSLWHFLLVQVWLIKSAQPGE